MIPVDYASAMRLYHRAQQLDQWPGEDYEGTSVLAGAKAVQEQGHMPEYRWAFNIDDVLATIAHYGPVVLGTDFYEGMARPNVHGLMHVDGEVLGGHCYLARGLLMRPTFASEPVVRIRNSWGEGWGRKGDAFICASDLQKLLQDNGEACVPVTRL